MALYDSLGADPDAALWGLPAKTAPAAQHAGLVAGLLATPARIAPKYFYDARGSALFEAITRTPEYYPTRTEQQILAAHGAALARALPPGATVLEWGAGNCSKASALCALLAPQCFVALDISADCVRAGARRLQAAFPAIRVQVLAADLTAPLALPADVPRARRVVFYPGSSIGNFDPPGALDLLRRMRAVLGPDGALLLGVDLVKAVPVLEAAYNDAAGVTAAFNGNVLAHVNRLIGSDFDERQWQHWAFFHAAQSRIEMHLEARCDTVARWPGHARRFVRGERIHTENSYKFTLQGVADLLARAGFAHAEPWTDAQGWFALVLARP